MPTLRRITPLGVLVVVLAALLPAAPASAAINTAPKIVKAEMKDLDGDGLADRVTITYNERVNHRADGAKPFPFRVLGPSAASSYKVLKVTGARRAFKLHILIRENPNGFSTPTVKYTRTKSRPVKDLQRKQARSQAFTRTVALPVTLDVTLAGEGVGTVATADNKINCGSVCSAKFPLGSSVTLTASPDSASSATFAGWSGACSGSATTCTVTMNEAKSVTAVFNAEGTFSLTLTKTAPAGSNEAGKATVTSTSQPSQTQQMNCGLTCTTQTVSFPEGTVVQLTGAEDTTTGSTLGAWTGCSTNTTTTCTVQMDGNKSIVLVVKPAWTLALTVMGQGTVTSTTAPSTGHPSLNCGSVCSSKFKDNTDVVLTATPAEGYVLSSWGTAGCAASSATCTVKMDGDKQITVTFEVQPPADPVLTLNIVGDGTVQCSANGSLPTGCVSGSTYEPGTELVLTATAGMGSVFTGWSGDCSGDLLTCSLTMNTSKTVTATFEAAAPDLEQNTSTGGNCTKDPVTGTEVCV